MLFTKRGQQKNSFSISPQQTPSSPSYEKSHAGFLGPLMQHVAQGCSEEIFTRHASIPAACSTEITTSKSKETRSNVDFVACAPRIGKQSLLEGIFLHLEFFQTMCGGYLRPVSHWHVIKIVKDCRAYFRTWLVTAKPALVTAKKVCGSGSGQGTRCWRGDV